MFLVFAFLDITKYGCGSEYSIICGRGIDEADSMLDTECVLLKLLGSSDFHITKQIMR